MAMKTPHPAPREKAARRLHGLVEAVEQRDPDQGPRERDQGRRGVHGLAAGGTHQAALRSVVRTASDDGSCHLSATGVISRFDTNPTASRPTMMNSAGR